MQMDENMSEIDRQGLDLDVVHELAAMLARGVGPFPSPSSPPA
jgi:hypothetical protein